MALAVFKQGQIIPNNIHEGEEITNRLAGVLAHTMKAVEQLVLMCRTRGVVAFF